MPEWDRLNNLQVDAIREIGNIGAGNAVTALAQMVNQRLEMAVPQAGILPLEDIVQLVGSEEDLVACVSTAVKGDAPAMILFLMTAPAVFGLCDLLLERAPGTTSFLEEMEQSLVAEVGNILTGSFLTGFSQVTGLSFVPEVPVLAFDMLGAVLSAALLEWGYWDDKVLVMETTFRGSTTVLSGHFFLAPSAGSLATVLKAIGLA